MAKIQRPSMKPRGKPFTWGDDPRRNTTGIRHQPSTAALSEAVSDDDLKTMWASGVARAKAGDVRWAALIAAYLDGKPVSRQESGDPGEFLGPDLSQIPTEELRAYIKAVGARGERPTGCGE